MARNVKLLLTDNVESLGIVGDVVNVRTGYARNFLMPRNLATQPSEEKIKALSAKRADAEKMLAELRKQREETAGKLQGVEVTLIRACNDQGHLYASITQQDVAAALVALGHLVKPRDVRISQVMKRVDNYDVHVKLDSDLDSVIKVHVNADRKLDLDRHHEEAAPADAQGKGDRGGDKAAAEKPADAGAEAAEAKPEKKEKKPKADRPDKGEKSDKAAEHKEAPAKGSFSKPSSKPDMPAPRPERPKRDRDDKGKGKH